MCSWLKLLPYVRICRCDFFVGPASAFKLSEECKSAKKSTLETDGFKFVFLSFMPSTCNILLINHTRAVILMFCQHNMFHYRLRDVFYGYAAGHIRNIGFILYLFAKVQYYSNTEWCRLFAHGSFMRSSLAHWPSTSKKESQRFMISLVCVDLEEEWFIFYSQ